ncbi:MAG: hypothetical protein ACREH3_07000, partial [Geminicoccales bacterium]
GEQWIRNPNYDPEAAQQELQLMQNIYENSLALQTAYNGPGAAFEFDPNNPEHLNWLQQRLADETQVPCEDWTQPFYYTDEQGQRQLRQVGRTEDGLEDDRGAVQWDAAEGGPRVLITPNDPTTGGAQRRDDLVHEYNSVKLVQAQNAGNNPATTGAARAFQQPTQMSEVRYRGGTPTPGQPVYNTQMMDNYAQSPPVIEEVYAEQQQAHQEFEDAPTQVTGPPDFED